ncbi:MAG TPA: DUF4127 family protein [Symbiobacteriaceae bacterium]|nr:DUF4127 family protein [Symbiobacteriaceae bacterium]
MRRWLFLPIDDRPITCDFPLRIAPLGEIELIRPPRELLGRFLTPGDGAELAQWLVANATGCEGAIINLDMLCYGGLVASRTTAVSAGEALERLAVLDQLKRRGLLVFATSVLMRLGITGSSPDALAAHQLIHRWSQAVAMPERAAEAAALEREIPPPVLAEYRGARERNHRVNREAVSLAARGTIDWLLLLQEDCSPQGVHRLEQAALVELMGGAAGVGAAGDRVRMLPGTDEGSLLLLARAALIGREAPSIDLIYSNPTTAAFPAPFEDRPLRETAALQVEAAGARLGPGAIWLFVNTPAVGYGDLHEYAPPPTGDELGAFTDGSPALVDAIAQALAEGIPAAVADVAFANGADPLFTEALLERTDWRRLAGYAAWNTAGNTLGTAIAMSILRGLDAGQRDRLHQEALLIRLLDDYCYQSLVRPEINAGLRRQGHNIFNLGPAYGAACEQVAQALQSCAEDVFARSPGARLERLAVRLPWPRTFEVEIELELSR